MVTNIFKPNATLGNVVGKFQALSKDFIKDDHAIIVGGPGNSLDRDSNYNTENDVDNIAKSSTHTNVPLWNADRSHIGLIGVSSLDVHDHTRHGLHHNLRGKAKICSSLLTRLGATWILVRFP
jgi:hypothetical protein